MILRSLLSNLINSGIYSTYVLIQFKSQSLLQHIRAGWDFGGLLKNQFIIPVFFLAIRFRRASVIC